MLVYGSIVSQIPRHGGQAVEKLGEIHNPADAKPDQRDGGNNHGNDQAHDQPVGRPGLVGPLMKSQIAEASDNHNAHGKHRPEEEAAGHKLVGEGEIFVDSNDAGKVPGGSFLAGDFGDVVVG